MKQVILVAVAASLLTACAALPQHSDQSIAHADVSGLIGNTVVEYDRQSPQFVVKVQLYADGTYQSSASGGFKTTMTTGTWKEQDGMKVGDTWIEQWPDGRMFKGRVVAGSN
ncbi:MAG TPA: hypothetical protein VIY90_16890 [Steroidobacteraceae bacterium]